MKFETIPFENVKEVLSNYLMKFYHGNFEGLKKHIFLNIPKSLYNELKNRPIGDKELRELLSKFDNDLAEKEILKIERLWKENEKKILEEIKNLTGLSISTESISCRINPYTNHGFYGENNISLGIGGGITEDDSLMVISHELFHIFYWRRLHELKITRSELGKEEIWEWALAEVTNYLLQREDSMIKFWPTSKHVLYPQIKEVYDKTSPLWKKENFDDYLIKSYELLRNGK